MKTKFKRRRPAPKTPDEIVAESLRSWQPNDPFVRPDMFRYLQYRYPISYPAFWLIQHGDPKKVG